MSLCAVQTSLFTVQTFLFTVKIFFSNVHTFLLKVGTILYLFCTFLLLSPYIQNSYKATLFLMGTFLFLDRPFLLQSLEQFLHKIVPIKYHLYKALYKWRPFFRVPLYELDPCKILRASFPQSVVQLQWVWTINHSNSLDHQQN